MIASSSVEWEPVYDIDKELGYGVFSFHSFLAGTHLYFYMRNTFITGDSNNQTQPYKGRQSALCAGLGLN